MDGADGTGRLGAAMHGHNFLRRVGTMVEERVEEALSHASAVPADRACVAMRARFLLIFAAVYGLSDADTATIGTTATELRHALGLSNLDIGILAAVATGVGALTTLPAGVLADRVNRTRLLAGSVGLWAVAMASSSAATSFAMLLATRVLLGAMVAVVGPITASLLGDLWPADGRSRIYGLITSGELVGAGAGFVVSGELAAISWRLAFLVLAVPAGAMAWYIRRMPEPSRTVQRIAATSGPACALPGRAVLDRGNEAVSFRSTWRVVAYVLKVPTNIILIVAETLALCFLNSVETFGVEFAKGQYHLVQAVVTVLLLVVGLGAVSGAIFSGYLSDSLVQRGHRQGRIMVSITMTVLAVVVLVPALLTENVGLAVPALMAGGFALAAVNPPLDATRLEVVSSSVWGRAEGVRTFVQLAFLAAAPIVFGFLADHLSGGGGAGIQGAFLVMLVPLLLSGVLLMGAVRTYPKDRAKALLTDHDLALTTRPPD
jgi:MFS family permease